MSSKQAATAASAILEAEALSALIRNLRDKDYTIIGPTIHEGALVFDEIQDVADLPRGWSADHAPGRFRLRERSDDAIFSYAATAQGLKRFLHPPEVRLFRAERSNGQFEILNDSPPAARRAFVGVRPCDLAALRKLDRVLLQDRFADPVYQAGRRDSFLIAVNCAEPSGNCFCGSMMSGPAATEGFDLLLTEIVEPGLHVFLAEAGSQPGVETLAALNGAPVTKELRRKADEITRDAAARLHKRIDSEGLKEILQDAFEHPRWEQTAARCLACANCTMVCPTCFCVTVEETSDIAQRHAERWRRWDSCFTQSFSYIHGGSVRLSLKARYRQWMTHKLATWVDQFGENGCVGCGRCITWCPAGIDITEEAAAIRGTGERMA